MKKLSMALALVLTLSFLSGCTSGKTVLKVYNAGKYIDRSVLSDFEKEFDVKVVYNEFDSNENMYVKIANDTYTYDVVVPSDYFIDRLIKEDRVVKLDKSQIPNINNIKPEYLAPSYDENNDYSVPYMVGTLGILYNKKMVSDPVDSWDILWNEKYANQIFMWDSVRDVVGAALISLGYSMNSNDDKQLEEAKEKLIAQKPLVQAYISDEMADKMIANEGALALTYSGDALIAINENPDLDYVIPKEGSNSWTDGFVLLKTAKEPELAHKFIDFMCRAEIAARNMEETGYTSPVEGAATEEMLNNPIMFPSAEILEKCEEFTYSSEATEKYSKMWVEITSH